MEIKMAAGGRKLLLVIACLEFEWQQGPHRLKGYVLAIFNKESGSQIFISCLAQKNTVFPQNSEIGSFVTQGNISYASQGILS